MRLPILTPSVVKAAIFVFVMMAAGLIAYHEYQPEQSWKKSALFSVKAMTTSGVPDPLSPTLKSLLIGYLPLSVFSWAVLVNALVNRRPRGSLGVSPHKGQGKSREGKVEIGVKSKLFDTCHSVS